MEKTTIYLPRQCKYIVFFIFVKKLQQIYSKLLITYGK
nr:MAG TPA: hypothetical protein [Caudoviricetes sp.]